MADQQTLTVEEAFSSGEPVLLYNPEYNEYVFVSNDMEINDYVVLSHPNRDEDRNLFVLQKTGDSTGLLFNPTYGCWLIVSNDKTDPESPDYVVEARQFKDEERNKFNFQSVEGEKHHKYRIFNPSYNQYIFVSNDLGGGPDHVVEAHPNSDEECNEFQLVMSENPTVKHIEFLMEQSRVIEQMEPIILGEMSLPNRSSVVQSMALKISKTESVISSFTYSGGFRIKGTTKFKGGIPSFLDSEVCYITVETTNNWSDPTSGSSSVQIHGIVTVDAPPNVFTDATCQVKLQHVFVPYKMTLVSKYGHEFLSYGDYQGPSFKEIFCECKGKPLP